MFGANRCVCALAGCAVRSSASAWVGGVAVRIHLGGRKIVAGRPQSRNKDNTISRLSAIFACQDNSTPGQVAGYGMPS